MQEKSPQSKFLDKIQSSVDKIDKKMKQIQVDGIQAVNKIDLTDPGKRSTIPGPLGLHPKMSENLLGCISIPRYKHVRKLTRVEKCQKIPMVSTSHEKFIY